MNYQRKDTMSDVRVKEKSITEFLMKARQLRGEVNCTTVESWNQRDVELHSLLLKGQSLVDESLKNDFDTKEAVLQIMNVITAANSYFAHNKEVKVLLMSKVENYVLRMFNVFGLDFTSGGGAQSSENREEMIRPYVKTAVNFRKAVRSGAKAKESPGYFLDLCDKLRDVILPNLGIKVVDDTSTEFDYFIVDRQQLLEEIANKNEDQKKKLIQSKQSALNNKEKDLTKWEEWIMSPQELIRKKYNVQMESNQNVLDEDMDGKKITPQTKKKDIG